MTKAATARIGRGVLLLLAAALVLLVAGGCSGTPAPTVDVASSTAVPTAAPTVPLPTATATVITPAVASVAIPDAQRAVPPSTAGPRAGAARVVDRFGVARREVALTFDAGADVGYAAEILDTLSRQQVVASFGMTGVWAERNPALVRRMVDEGHQLMNHTYDHSSFTGVSTRAGAMPPSRRREQIERTEAIVRSIAGVDMRPYFRPPYGDYDTTVNADIADSGYRFNVMWTVDSLGWNGLPAGGIVQRCLQRATPGAIFVFHVGAASQDAAALSAIIEGLRRDGYTFATVRQMDG